MNWVLINEAVNSDAVTINDGHPIIKAIVVLVVLSVVGALWWYVVMMDE